MSAVQKIGEDLVTVEDQIAQLGVDLQRTVAAAALKLCDQDHLRARETFLRKKEEQLRSNKLQLRDEQMLLLTADK